MGFATICNQSGALPMVNQWNHNPGVGGSSPSSATGYLLMKNPLVLVGFLLYDMGLISIRSFFEHQY